MPDYDADRHRGRPQRADGGRRHGPWRHAGALPGEEPFHRRDGLHHRAGPWLPLRAGGIDPVPDAQRDLRRPRVRRLSHLRARGAVGQHRRRGEPPILLYSDPERLLAHLGDDPRTRRRHGHGRSGGLGRCAGPGHRAIRRAQAAEVTRRDVGVRRQRDRSARPFASPCSAA